MRPAGLLADPFEGRPIGERMRHALALFLLATWVLGLVVQLSRPPAYPPWFGVGANAALAAAILVLLVSWRSPLGSLRATQATVVLAAVVRLVEATALHQPAGLVDYLPMTYVLTMALGGTGIAFRPAVGLPVMLANLAGLLIERVRSVGMLQSGAEAGYIAAAGLAGFLLARTLSDELARVERAAATTQQRRNEAVLAMERTGLRERWDALVHDTVLASLTLAARGQVEEAAALARDALRGLSGSRPVQDDPVQAIAAHAGRLGLDAQIDVGGWLPGRPGEALVVATCEALTNIARHSGELRARVSSAWTDEGLLRVIIEDDGRGFDPARVGERRLGIRQAIHASMRAVGGGAAIESSPGAGTRVILHALPIEPAPVDAGDTRSWSMASLAWFSVLFALQIASGVVIGGLYLHDQVSTAVSVAGMILIPVLTVLLAVVPVRRGWWVALLVTVGVVWAALLGNVRDLSVIDWRTWFVGSFDSAVVLIALRDRLRRALLVIAGATLAGSVALLARGAFSAWALIEATYQTLIWAAVSGYSRRLMDRARRWRGRRPHRCRRGARSRWPTPVTRRSARVAGRWTPTSCRCSAGWRRAKCSPMTTGGPARSWKRRRATSWPRPPCSPGRWRRPSRARGSEGSACPSPDVATPEPICARSMRRPPACSRSRSAATASTWCGATPWRSGPAVPASSAPVSAADGPRTSCCRPTGPAATSRSTTIRCWSNWPRPRPIRPASRSRRRGRRGGRGRPGCRPR